MASSHRAVLLAVVLSACSASNAGNQGSGYGGNAGNAAGSSGDGGSAGSGGSAGTAAGTAGTAGSGGVGGAAGTLGSGAVGTGGSAGETGAGGTAGVGGAGSGGAGAVTFDWPETTPGTGTCKAGHYMGDFNGFFAPSAIFFPAPIPVIGNVDLTLDESLDGEFFKISNGKVSGIANGLFPYSADVVGTLNCKTRKLEGGFLKNGKYTVGVTDFPFEGPITSDYDTLTFTFVNGTWDVKEPNPIFGGLGTWTSKNVP